MKLCGLALAIIAVTLPLASVAQGISDPTRPPPVVLSLIIKGGSPATAAGASEQDPASRLQMLTIGPAQKYAIIGGKVVRLGGMVEGAKLVEVRPDSIVLQSPEGAKETVGLYQGITIKKVQPDNAAPATMQKGKDSTKGSKKENR